MTDRSKVAELIELASSFHPSISEEYSESPYSFADIEEAIEGYQLPELLIDLYTHPKTIQFINLDKELIPCWWIVGLYDIAALVEIFNECRDRIIKEYHGGSENRYLESLSFEEFDWQPDMIPFLEDGGGSYICVRTLPGDRSVWAIYKEVEPAILNSSLDLFISTRVEYYQRGAYFKCNDSDLQMDWGLSEEILTEMDAEINGDFMV